jgi:nickel-type superoxide dismutase maturation protease
MVKDRFPTLRHATWADVGLWLLRQRWRLQVQGKSMLPTLLPGREVLINPRAYTQQEPQVDDLVVAAHPQQPGFLIIKRVAAVGEGAFDLRGDNPEASTDSRQFGWVSRDRILGQVVCRFL